MVSYNQHPSENGDGAVNSSVMHADNTPNIPGHRSKQLNILRLVTINLVSLIEFIDPFYRYELASNPKRILTKPSKGIHNNGVDNATYDYILAVGDQFGNEEGRRFIILELLGQGTFGQVVKCQNISTGELVAIKIIKNQTAYFNQSMMEVTILEMLNSSKYNHQELTHITKMKDTFVFKKHLCIVFELLSLNIFELLKQNHFKGFSHQLIRIFLQQILSALCLLNEAKIVHCDLKPENILLQTMDSAFIKVIDFGSACHEQHTVYTYIQSRFYRSPEVILGLPYSSSIDIWSLGCIAAELFLGIPIFPGSSNYDQILRIVECIGMPPTYMLDVGRNSSLYFEKPPSTGVYKLKTREQYEKDICNGHSNQPQLPEEKLSKRYFSAVKLEEIILTYPMKSGNGLTPQEIEKEMESRRSLYDLISNLLNINPIERWSPQQARLHPYIVGEPWKGPFIPPGPGCLSSYSNAQQATIIQYPEQSHQTYHRPRSSTINSQMYNIPPNLERITRVVSKDSFSSSRSIPGSSMYQLYRNSTHQSQSSTCKHPQNMQASGATSPPSFDEIDRGQTGSNARNGHFNDYNPNYQQAYQQQPYPGFRQPPYSANQCQHNPYAYQNKLLFNNRLREASSSPGSFKKNTPAFDMDELHGYGPTTSMSFSAHRRSSNPSGPVGIGENANRSGYTKRTVGGGNILGAGSRRSFPNSHAFQHHAPAQPPSQSQ
ncbi:dual specificity protein kinase yak1 [Mitosporidium daphniae]|uniref:Protein kinase domain-containing protein n=1 Tax=Mitosporidium daphniae TaxID=1485682 RepID=A0A098VUF7_9MICR|nr:uncharacterized protein DI09_155p30 [Mitosporidium daphniae]KGG52590.1 hypothetical protein DI09_155p30 [Mitosporidium daphniae]|eukprot:XP_013239026.1 uncharacterized protein DI09_155p30 [Mitosporidium daphniae]